MAIAFGTLFSKLGRLGKLLYLTNQYQAGLPAAFGSAASAFAGDPPAVGNLLAARDAAAAFAGQWLGLIPPVAQDTLLAAVAADAPSEAGSVPAALAELARQMAVASETVKRCVPAVTVAAVGTPAGSGGVVASALRADGQSQELLIPEVARVACTNDSFGGTATAGQEPFRFRGDQVTSTDPLSAGWPDGSGADASLSAVSPGAAADLIDGAGEFDVFTIANIPDGWTIAVGTAGTQVLAETSTVYSGVGSLKLVGSATNTALTYPLSLADLGSLTQYAANLWVRVSGVPAAGVLSVELVDGTGTVINDDAGNANAWTVALTGLTAATWTRAGGTFRLPRALPAVVSLRLRLSTALSTGTNLYLDRLSFTEMAYPYAGGPAVAVFSGAAAFVAGDAFSVTATNTYGGASQGATFGLLMDRLFPEYRSSGVRLPSTTGTPTQLDSLITS